MRWAAPLLLLVLLPLCRAPPVAPKVEEKLEVEEDLADTLEYSRYLQEVMKELENDPEVTKKLKEAFDKNETHQMGDQLEFASKGVRTRLDEIKRREVARLNQLKMEMERQGGKDLRFRDHVDHGNPHTFESRDLQKLFDKVTRDLVNVDTRQEEEFKRYEMEKELRRKSRIRKIKNKLRRAEEEKKLAESRKRHAEHERLHQPGSEAQMKEVWESEDHLDRDAFDPKTYFALHDKDGNGFWDEEELEAMMVRDLDKVYDPNNPDDDPMERYHEMMRMRNSMLDAVDENKDRLVSRDEYLRWTSSKRFKEDPEWKTTEEMERPVFSEEEMQRFRKEYERRHPDERLEDEDDHEDARTDAAQPHVKAMEQEDRQQDSKTHAEAQPAAAAGTAAQTQGKL